MGGIGPELSKLGTIVFGDRAWDQISRAAQGLMLLRTEPVLLMHPEVLILR